MSVLNILRRAGEGASRVTERYIPDAWVVCMVLTTVAFALAIFGVGARPDEAVRVWGEGLWGLLRITMQFTIAVFAAYACVVSPVGFRLFDRLARVPNPERPLQAILLMALFSNITGYLNWALCFVASALFIPFLARRNPNTDVRLLVAAAFLGVGTVTNGGLSGSAALIMATPHNPLIEPAVGAPIVDRLYPITETIFSTFNLTVMGLLVVISVVMVMLLHPRGQVVTFSQEHLDRILPKPESPPERTGTPASRLENARIWTWLAGGMILYTLGYNIVTDGFGASWNINAYNAVFLGLALLLHGNPLSFVRACRRGLDAAWGIVLQFPFYGGIFGLMTGTDLGVWLGELFVQVSNQALYPLMVYGYSAVLNFFVPSGGSKWLIEAPYILAAGERLGVSDTTVLLAYIYGDSLTNLLHPYMAIPIMSITGLKFGEFAGYCFFVAIAILLVMTGAMLVIPPNL